MAQDAHGFIYISSVPSAYVYDGASWRVIRLPTASAGIRKLATTADGTVYMGGAGVIGYLRGAGETAEHVSLADRLPPSALGYDDIYDVLAVGNTVYFADEEKILIWRNNAFTVVPCATPPQSRGARLHRVRDTVYVTALEHPLYRLVQDRLELVADDPIFRQNQIVTVETGAAGALVVLTTERGFFQLAGQRLAPLRVEANRWLDGKSILGALRLADRSLVVAFTAVSGDGGMRFSATGEYQGPIDNSLGLYVKTLRGFFSDREGGLWIGTETGVFRLEWPSPVTIFDAVNGLGAGAVTDVARHDGVLYAATTEGVFRLVPVDATGRCARFERVFSKPVYSLLSHPAGMLVSGYNEISIQSSSGFEVVAALPPGGGTLQQSLRDPDRVLIHAAGKVRSIRHTSEGWQEATLDDSSNEAPASTVDAAQAYARSLPQLVKTTAGTITRVREETDSAGSVLWVCGANGLLRVDIAREFSPPVPYAVRLHSPDTREGDQLAQGHKPLAFTFVAPRYKIADSVTYQTRLVGLEEDWSEWSDKRERSFTSLPPARYRFEVRARDADGQLSVPATLAFSVLGPWWLTPGAFFAYVLTGVGVIVVSVRLGNRALRQRATRLEAIITQRTSELAQKNLELTRLHQLEFDEKIAARLAEEKARLEVLRYQLNPHFLFNTLASISSALPSTQSTARTMVERLANFCRLTLHRTDDRDWTTLGEEMKLLRVYLEIEQSRWGDLLDVSITCDPALDGERLPHFLLLPLVENALKYGRATSPDRVGLRLRARRESGGTLVLEVSNTGTWIEPSEKKTVSSLGIGLDNLRERLTRYYPRMHELTLTPADGWVTVELRLTLAS